MIKSCIHYKFDDEISSRWWFRYYEADNRIKGPGIIDMDQLNHDIEKQTFA